METKSSASWQDIKQLFPDGLLEAAAEKVLQNRDELKTTREFLHEAIRALSSYDGTDASSWWREEREKVLQSYADCFGDTDLS